ncbi:Hsp20 family protein [Sphingobium sp. BHU LFT2]|uniref:Hsp20 family protein n=1 Tax=Sphingobium sp. BHU LFT2 TaxID=2807634 RepID=UPI0033361E42
MAERALGYRIPQRLGYRITLALAGFAPSDIEVVAQQNLLVVSGRRAEDNGQGEHLHRGITARAFETRFQLADFMEAGHASFEHGLLSIELKRVVPEAMKPRRIEIAQTAPYARQLGEAQQEVREAA